MSGKGAKGLITTKHAAASSSAANKDKDKKKPTSRSSRAGLQVIFFHFHLLKFVILFGFHLFSPI